MTNSPGCNGCCSYCADISSTPTSDTWTVTISGLSAGYSCGPSNCGTLNSTYVCTYLSTTQVNGCAAYVYSVSSGGVTATLSIYGSRSVSTSGAWATFQITRALSTCVVLDFTDNYGGTPSTNCAAQQWYIRGTNCFDLADVGTIFGGSISAIRS